MSGNIPHQSATSPTQRNFFTQALSALTHPRLNQPPAFPPVQSSSNHNTHSAPNTYASDSSSKPDVAFHVQMFPHTETLSFHGTHIGFNFSPVEKDISPGTIIKIGRKVEKEKTKQKKKTEILNALGEGAYTTDGGISDGLAGEVLMEDPEHMDIDGGSGSVVPEIKHDFIAFRSKVVSRTHAEMWVSREGQVYLKDVGSSSGTFVNRQRLSVSGKESKPYALKSGDVIQLGVDYQGRQEEIYKCVLIKIFISPRTAKKPRPNYTRVRASLRALLAAMNPYATSPSEPSATDCCICLCAMSPYQALFLAPCSHCYHYKCVLPILGSGIMFPCPLCRQVANLDANVTETENLDDYDSSVDLAGDEEWEKLANEIQNAGTRAAATPAAPEPEQSSSDNEIVMDDDEFLERGKTGGGVTLARPGRNMDIPKSSSNPPQLGFSPGTPISIGNHLQVSSAANNTEGSSETQQHTPEELDSAVIASTGAALDGLAQTLANGDPLAATSVLEGYAAMMEDLFEAFPSAFSEARKESLRDTVQQQRRRFERWEEIRSGDIAVAAELESQESGIESEDEKGKKRV